METIISVLIGICLSAASGFRIFIPFLILSIASFTGYIASFPGAEWLGTYQALIAFSVATIIEIGGFYSPWIDNMLDLVATPASIFAGSILTSSMLIDIDPFLKWSLAIILGGGTALNVQLLTVKARALSSVFTSGIGNPIVSTIENFSAVLISVLAITIPVITLVLILIIVYLIYTKIIKRKNKDNLANV